MGGGLLQLVAYGAQDIYLTGNPQITFFKVIYRRHTNFSMECVKQTITGVDTVVTTGTSKGSVIISRNGDLLHQLWVRTNSKVSVLSGSSSIFVNINGDCLIDEAILEIAKKDGFLPSILCPINCPIHPITKIINETFHRGVIRLLSI